jgi:hypothetical protein
MIVWAPTTIAIALLNTTKRALLIARQINAKKYRWRASKEIGRGGASGKSYEFAVDITEAEYYAICAKYEREFNIAENGDFGLDSRLPPRLALLRSLAPRYFREALERALRGNDQEGSVNDEESNDDENPAPLIVRIMGDVDPVAPLIVKGFWLEKYRPKPKRLNPLKVLRSTLNKLAVWL